MIQSIILSMAIFNWIAGLALLVYTKSPRIISEVDYERSVWSQFQMGYTIAELKRVVEKTENERIRNKLRKMIYIRKAGNWLLFSTPVLILLGNL